MIIITAVAFMESWDLSGGLTQSKLTMGHDFEVCMDVDYTRRDVFPTLTQSPSEVLRLVQLFTTHTQSPSEILRLV